MVFKVYWVFAVLPGTTNEGFNIAIYLVKKLSLKNPAHFVAGSRTGVVHIWGVK